MHQLKGCSHKPRPYISSISDTVSSFGIIIIVFCIKVFIIQPFEVQTTNFVSHLPTLSGHYVTESDVSSSEVPITNH